MIFSIKAEEVLELIFYIFMDIIHSNRIIYSIFHLNIALSQITHEIFIGHFSSLFFVSKCPRT